MHDSKKDKTTLSLTIVTHHVKRDHMGVAKSFYFGQPARSAQADHGRNFSLLEDFLCIK